MKETAATRETVTFSARILPEVNHLDKINVLHQAIEQIESYDAQFNAAIEQVIVGEQQTGEWAKTMRETTDSLTKKANALTTDLKDQVQKSVVSFDRQVDDMKTQKITMNYSVSRSAF